MYADGYYIIRCGSNTCIDGKRGKEGTLPELSLVGVHIVSLSALSHHEQPPSQSAPHRQVLPKVHCQDHSTLQQHDPLNLLLLQ